MVSDEQIEALVTLLGVVDAAFVPVRTWDSSLSVSAWKARRDYPITGAAWHGSGDSDTAKQATQRLRASPADEGYVRLVKRKSDKTVGHVLTDAGDTVARCAVGLPLIDRSLEVADRIFDLRNDPQTAVASELEGGGPWVNEQKLAGVSYADTHDPIVRQKLVVLEEQLFPCLIRGIVKASADVRGRCWYAVTVTGRPSEACSLPPFPSFAPFPSQRWIDLYATTIKSTLVAFGSSPMPGREIGPLPFAGSPTLVGSERRRTA